MTHEHVIHHQVWKAFDRFFWWREGAFAVNNVLQPDAQVSPFAFLNPVQTLVVSTSAPATWLLPTEIAFALFLFLLPQNSSRR